MREKEWFGLSCPYILSSRTELAFERQSGISVRYPKGVHESL